MPAPTSPATDSPLPSELISERAVEPDAPATDGITSGGGADFFTIVAIINKDASPLPLDLPGYALALSLSAPSLTSTRVSLTEPAANREVSTVQPYTAVLLRSTRP